MAEIRHRVGIAARVDNVYEALTTTRGVASWWWEDARGDARATGRLECYFGDRPMVVMQIDEEQPNERVRWRCVQGPEEWVDTTVAFDVKAEAFARGERRQSDTPFHEPWPLEAWPDVPPRFLLCRNDHFFPATFMQRVVREHLVITPDERESSHVPAISHPEELAERLEAYRIGGGVGRIRILAPPTTGAQVPEPPGLL